MKDVEQIREDLEKLRQDVNDNHAQLLDLK